ncbi:arabinofuranosyltransferase [Amycolatopsis thermophila]|uniref:Galactan 5-O-arabinofuranosyltransferase n=1 Tax=Amycolatopsis thermophila TaxID=206084 RepID=A0ABU0ESD5_9PSEU|nr:arabinofuranosyltransferase [Amycolatopsis thermophila]MDQ0377993.1 galactan 5-O-arabinofuranosyltransferase [Amycolatopsis thermophila]
MTTTLARPGDDTATEPAPRHPLTRLGPGRTLAELVLGTVAAVVVSLVLQFGANKLSVDPGTYVPDALVNLAVAVIVVVLFGSLWYSGAARWPSWVRVGGSWVALTALSTLLLAIPLQGTRFFLGGSSVDNTFRLQYMERLTETAGLADVNYHGLAAYYPGGWFWLGGRFANLLGLEGWAAYKPYSITWAAVAGVVAFVLWSLVVRRRMALLASVATVLAGFVALGPEEPYAWPTTAWLPPILVLTWAVLRRRERVPAWTLVLIGVYLGFSGVTYTLHLVFGVFAVVVLALVALALDVRDGEPVGAVLKRLLLRLVGIGVVTGLLSLITWGPFILAGGLGKPNVAAHFLPEISAYFPMPFQTASFFGVLCLAGLVWLVVRARREPVALVLLVLTALVYLWFALSSLALLVRTTLLSFRFIVTVDVALAVAGVFALAELVRALPKLTEHVRPVRTVAFVLAVLGAVSVTQTVVGTTMKDTVDTAESDYYPDGWNANYGHDPAQDGYWTPQLIATIGELTGRPPTGNIVLSAYDRLLSFQPYWGFQQTTPHYANPLAGYTQRNDEIRSWATARDSAGLIAKLRTNPHEAPNVFVLRRAADGTLVMPIATDTFPRAVPLRVDDITFAPELFSGPGFERRDVGPFAVIVDRSAQPIS